MSTRRSLRTRNALTSPTRQSTPTISSRPRRTTSGQHKNVTIARDSSDSPDGGKKAIHLTVKMPSNKLREATSGSVKKGQSVAERERLEPAEIVSGPRGSRAKKSYVVESDSDDDDGDEDAEGDEVDDEEDGDGDVHIEDQIGEPEQSDDDDEDVEVTGLADEDDEEQDEADENEDAEGDDDVEMEDESPMPPPPIIKRTGPASKPSVTITPAQSGKLKSVEAKEMAMEDDDEDLSSIGSDGEEDAEGEDVEMEQDDDDGDIQSLGTGSRGSTPDVSKMTKRQRSRLDQVMGSDDFLQLPMEPQQKKIFTPEEHAMRRAEMARRRKNLSEKRNEEEKVRPTLLRLISSISHPSSNGFPLANPRLLPSPICPSFLYFPVLPTLPDLPTISFIIRSRPQFTSTNRAISSPMFPH